MSDSSLKSFAMQKMSQGSGGSLSSLPVSEEGAVGPPPFNRNTSGLTDGSDNL
jgi:hypothetical protein